MAQTNQLTISVYPKGSDDVLAFENVHYMSFVSSPGGAGEGTYGIPAILSEHARKAEGLPLRVLYVNPANVTAIEAVRES